ncbi:beta-N-acetylglucosaminidase, partial [Streptomyces nojiriensis]
MMSTPRRHTRVRTIATATVAALVTLALPGCTAASDAARARGPADAATATAPATKAAPPAEAAPTPTPTPTYPLSTAPRTIPAVREHVPARGPGWKPTPDARVVVAPDDTAALSDEAKLLAGEL